MPPTPTVEDEEAAHDVPPPDLLDQPHDFATQGECKEYFCNWFYESYRQEVVDRRHREEQGIEEEDANPWQLSDEQPNSRLVLRDPNIYNIIARPQDAKNNPLTAGYWLRFDIRTTPLYWTAYHLDSQWASRFLRPLKELTKEYSLWQPEPPAFIHITQKGMTGGMVVAVRLFHPQPGDVHQHHCVTCRPWHSVESNPYAIMLMEQPFDQIDRCVRQSGTRYMKDAVRLTSESMVYYTFETLSKCVVTRSSKLDGMHILKQATKFFIACRMLERRWAVVGRKGLGKDLDQNEDGPNDDPQIAHGDEILITPAMEAQLQMLIVEVYLKPLQHDITQGLEFMLDSGMPHLWFPCYLTMFVLLYNLDCFTFEKWIFGIGAGAVDGKESLPIQFMPEMQPMLSSIHHTARKLLSQWHVRLHGRKQFEYSQCSLRAPGLLDLDVDRLRYLGRLRRWQKLEMLNQYALKMSRSYDKPGYLAFQLFESGWAPTHFAPGPDCGCDECGGVGAGDSSNPPPLTMEEEELFDQYFSLPD
ncbi:hypothetical protein F5Y15DRAFT_430783 [Xylariaceae sp. FL0016]|nr:hypothetical protein F5Y15DRAFT_430783 [Xylariaceae sp. FL0016]